VCAPGYMLSEGACIEIDSCLSNTCPSPNSYCEDLPPPLDGFTCVCRTGFTGNASSTGNDSCTGLVSFDALNLLTRAHQTLTPVLVRCALRTHSVSTTRLLRLDIAASVTLDSR
jgi:hypothetical protein